MIPLHADRRSLVPLVVGSLVLIAAGAAGMFVYLGGGREQTVAAPTAASGGSPTAPAGPEVVVTLAPDLLSRAGIETALAERGTSAGSLRVPAMVQPHGYRQVVVRSTSAGRVLSIAAELGQLVKRGDRVAEVHSPEVAEVERAYISASADLVYARQQIARLERLVKIGAASQQELEGVRAQEASLVASLEGARAGLQLLGRTAAQVTALTGAGATSPIVSIVAPITGTVTSRPVNPGQTIDASAELLTIVDLDIVWIVGEVYERDLAQVRIGSPVTMTSAAFPGEELSGRVTYVDPEVAPDSRTARVRVEIANPGGRLRLGMLMDMRVGASPRESMMVPRSAVQTIGGVDVVYVVAAGRAGTFVERSVRLGVTAGEQIEVLAGVRDGERVVTSGSFFVRSERERANLAPPAPVAGAAAATVDERNTPASRPAAGGSEPRTIDVTVSADRFTPAEVTLEANTRIRLRFTRQVEETCATEVMVPSLGLTKPLPVGQAVLVDIPPQKAGTIEFMCGMKMLKGKLIVR